jgi:RNA polymerase sigma factor (TIGR02999 family)
VTATALKITTDQALDDSVYRELKRIAHALLRARGRAPTLRTTELVHEAYLRLGGPDAFEGPAHFYGSAARAMRLVLVDIARRRLAAKRGGQQRRVALTTASAVVSLDLDRLLVFDAALEKLRALSERLHQVVELRFYAGLSVEEVATCLQVTTRTVERDWTKARLLLARELADLA